jgi:FtsH-binding integral membrane protein
VNSQDNSTALKIVLRSLGVIFTIGIPILNRVWPGGWAWQPEQHAYLHMIWSIYAALGVFLLIAANNPSQHRTLIWFTAFSSVTHGTAMAIHSITDPGQIGHLWGDVAALYITAMVLAFLMVRRGSRQPQ